MVAVTLVIAALQYGGYGNQFTAGFGIAIWLFLLIGTGTTLLPRASIETPGIIAIALILALLAVTALSIIWAVDAGRAFSQTILMLGVAGIFLAAMFASRRSEGRSWLLGLTLGLAVIVLLAAMSRFFPGIGNDPELSESLGPIMSGRLSWPLGYWNATGMVTVMLIVLLFWHSAHDSRPAIRRVSAALVPAALGVLYLTASRGGLSALTIGLVMLIAFGPDRRRQAVTAAVALLAGLPVILVVSNLGEVAHADTGSTATVQGLVYLAVSVAFCLLAWAVLPAARRWSKGFQPERRVVIGGLTLLAVVALGLLIASNPIERISEFTSVPFGGVDRSENQAFAAEHLLSANGNGRWQLWDAALGAFGSQPFHGIGAGGFEAYFKEHGDYWMKTVDAHSLPFQTLAEVGILGFLALIGFFGVVIWQAVVRLRRPVEADSPEGRERSEMVAFLTLLAVGCFSLSVDWTGQFPVIFGTLLICSAMLVGPAYGSSRTARSPGFNRTRLAVAAGVIVLAGAAVLFSTRAYQAASALESSRQATSDGNGILAVSEAERAVSATPWDGEAWAGVASAREDLGNLGGALSSATEATSRAPNNEEFWLQRARIESALGLTSSWAYSMATAYLLDPNSAYWTDQLDKVELARESGTPDIALESVFGEALKRESSEP